MTAVKPSSRITRGQHCRIAKYANVNLLANDVFDLEVSGGYIVNELRFVVAFKGIGKEKILSHDAIQRLTITPDHRLHPLVIELPNVLLSFEGRRLIRS